MKYDKEQMNRAMGMLDTVHSIAHSVAYPMVTEVIETQASMIERIQENENNIADVEDGIQTTQTALLDMNTKIGEQVHAILTEQQNTPQMDATISEMQGRIDDLEEKVAGLIDILSSACNLE